MSGALFSFRMVPVISSMLAVRRIDVAPLVREAGLPDEALQGDVIAPLERIQTLLDLAARRADLPLFGIELAERVPTGAFGLTEFLMRSAPSCETALLALCEFSPLINPLLEFRFTKQPATGYLHFAVPGQRAALGTHLNEYTLMLAVRQFSGVLGEPLAPARVWFAHTDRDRAAALAARFSCPVELGAADCGFAITERSLARRPPTADPALFDFLSSQARAQLANVGSRDIISQVARVIEARLASGALSGADIARAMATTFRSLQRHLAAAGTTYRDVLQHVRLRRRAELARTGLTPNEIATRLGFSNVSAMRRSLD
ncbi:MAG: AraC family transcriptional regulator ligand-binding domain-containing protein [Deltaproteobacteria bacterium]|nr:AraC family transcriptional regulator ligand-binding domain-containing protein [Deltaproteobacteria bacterium]